MFMTIKCYISVYNLMVYMSLLGSTAVLPIYVGMTRFFSFSPYIGIGAKSRNRPKIDKTRPCIAKYTR